MLYFPSRFGIINIHANGNYLSGSLPMFNSTTGLHHLRASRGIVSLQVYFAYWRSTASCFPGTEKNRRHSPAFIATLTPVHLIRQLGECRAKGWTSMGHRLLGRVTARLSIPLTYFVLRCVACIERTFTHSHVNFWNVS